MESLPGSLCAAPRQQWPFRYVPSDQSNKFTKIARALSLAQTTATFRIIRNREKSMLDFIDIAATLLVFALGIAYLYGCDRLKGRRS